MLPEKIQARFDQMQTVNQEAIKAVGFTEEQIEDHFYLNLRYIGTNTSIMIEMPAVE